MKKIDCFRCQYFYVTWEQANPRGCKAFGFKTWKLPSQIVEESSGQPCMQYRPKPSPEQNPSNKKGWIA